MVLPLGVAKKPLGTTRILLVIPIGIFLTTRNPCWFSLLCASNKLLLFRNNPFSHHHYLELNIFTQVIPMRRLFLSNILLWMRHFYLYIKKLVKNFMLRHSIHKSSSLLSDTIEEKKLVKQKFDADKKFCDINLIFVIKLDTFCYCSTTVYITFQK